MAYFLIAKKICCMSRVESICFKYLIRPLVQPGICHKPKCCSKKRMPYAIGIFKQYVMYCYTKKYAISMKYAISEYAIGKKHISGHATTPTLTKRFNNVDQLLLPESTSTAKRVFARQYYSKP
ncbi:hypothetical protein K501DRAFT_268699 [Backusella circina FSU 941]|nr:hypothetical protein K501DRAFT_268699 [Backusella circina FSU 941]